MVLRHLDSLFELEFAEDLQDANLQSSNRNTTHIVLAWYLSNCLHYLAIKFHQATSITARNNIRLVEETERLARCQDILGASAANEM